MKHCNLQILVALNIYNIQKDNLFFNCEYNFINPLKRFKGYGTETLKVNIIRKLNGFKEPNITFFPGIIKIASPLFCVLTIIRIVENLQHKVSTACCFPYYIASFFPVFQWIPASGKYNKYSKLLYKKVT